MKNYLAILITAVCLVMCACDPENNFFFHPVEFKGEITEPKLVVTGVLHAGYPPTVFVNHSVFFTEYQRETADEDAMRGGNVREYGYRTNHRYLSDATVEMQINDGEWLPLYAKAFREEGCYYTCDHVLAEGEKVLIRVQHNDFRDVATASQRIPASPRATIRLGQYTADDLTLPCTIELPAYQGDATDLLCITAITYAHNYRTFRDPYDRTTRIDTMEVQYPYVYSQDIRFAQYDKTNQTLSSNYFGAGILGLYAAVPEQPTQYAMRVVAKDKYHSYYDPAMQSSYTLDSIVVDVSAVSRDAYLTTASLLTTGYYAYYNYNVPDYFSTDANNSVSDIIDLIKEIFDTMGSMEAVQLYDNIEGGIGHVTSVASQHFCIIPN